MDAGKLLCRSLGFGCVPRRTAPSKKLSVCLVDCGGSKCFDSVPPDKAVLDLAETVGPRRFLPLWIKPGVILNILKGSQEMAGF